MAPRQGDFTDNSNIFRMKNAIFFHNGEEDNKTDILSTRSSAWEKVLNIKIMCCDWLVVIIGIACCI